MIFAAHSCDYFVRNNELSDYRGPTHQRSTIRTVRVHIYHHQHDFDIILKNVFSLNPWQKCGCLQRKCETIRMTNLLFV